MDVLMISTFPPRRCGIGDYTADLVSELASNGGLQIGILTYRDGVSVELESRNTFEISRELETRTTPARILSLLKRSGADLVHLQSSSFLHHRSVNTAVARACPVPLVTTVHDTPGSLRIFYAIPSLRKLYRNSSRLITHSQGVSETLTGFHDIEGSRIVHIPMGVDTGRYHPGANGTEIRSKYDLRQKRIILFFGFLRPGKGLEILLRAWSLVQQSHSDSLLVIAGGIPTEARRYSFLSENEVNYPNRLQGLARQLGIGRRIVFTDYVPEQLVPGLMAAAEFVVLPYGGAPSQSAALLKALSSGKPVIATKTAGFQEYLEGGEDAILVSQGDVEALASSIALLLEDSDLARDMGSQARQKALKNHDWSLVAKKTSSTYQELFST